MPAFQGREGGHPTRCLAPSPTPQLWDSPVFAHPGWCIHCLPPAPEHQHLSRKAELRRAPRHPRPLHKPCKMLPPPLAPARRYCSRLFSTVDSGPAALGRGCARLGVPSLAPGAPCPSPQLPRGTTRLCARSTGSHMHVPRSFPLLVVLPAGLCSAYLVPGHSCSADAHCALALHTVSWQSSSASQQQIN